MDPYRNRLDMLLRSPEWSKEERQWVQEYLNRNGEEDLRLLAWEHFKDDKPGEGAPLSQSTSAAILEEIHQKIDVGDQPRYKWSSWMSIAATILLIIGVLTTWKYSENSQSYMHAVVTTHEMKQIVLSDGTRVRLNANSQLQFPDQFTFSIREVYLTGEAFFEVTPNRQKPFVIHTGYLVTRVLGTSFNIKAYEKDQSTTVAVESGEVKVSDVLQGTGVVLKANRQAIYNKADKVFTEAAYKVKVKAAGTRNMLVFNNTPLNKVIQQLEQEYKIDIIPEQTLADCTIYADFRGERLEKVLRILVASLDAKLIINGNRYYLKGKGCQNEVVEVN